MMPTKQTPMNERGRMSDPQTQRRRILEELCIALDLTDIPAKLEMLLAGGAMRLEDYAVWFVCDDRLSRNEMFVYVDLGAPLEPQSAHKRLLKLNFELAAGLRGVMSLHPDNDHVLYTFRYPLTAASSGKDLLATLVRFADTVAQAPGAAPA